MAGEPADIVGTAGVDVIPVTVGFHERLRAKVLPGLVALGDEIGRRIAEGMLPRIADAIPRALGEGSKRATADAARYGARTGGAFADSLKAKLEVAFRSLPKLNISLNDTGVDAQLARLRAKLEDLRNKRIGIDLSVEDAQAKIDAIDERLARLGASSPNVRIRVDVATARAAIEEFRAEVMAASRDPLTIPVRAGAFRDSLVAQVEAAQAALPAIEITADSDPARQELDRYRAELAAIPTRLETEAHFSDAEAVATIGRLRARLDELAARRVDIDIRADAARASAELAVIGAEVDALASKRPKISLDTSIARRDILALALNLAALTAIPLAPVLTAGLGGILSAFTAGGAGAGAFGLAALPAIKSVTTALQAQTQATKQVTHETSAQANAGEIAAQRALQMAGAQQALASAQRQAAESIRSADEQVKLAERGVSDAVVQAADQRKAALQGVQDAEKSLADAQDALTQARKAAQQQLKDLANQLADSDLSSRSAALRVDRAREQLAAAQREARLHPTTADPLDLVQAQLDLDQALQAQKEQLQSQKDLQQSAADQKKAGVDGNDAVRQAAEKLAAAQQDVADKTKAVADAQANVAKVAKDSARTIADAERKEADAVRNAANVRVQAADSIASAERGIEAARLSASKVTAQAVTATDKYRAALAKLTPEQRKLFDAIAGPSGLKKAFTEWSKSVQPDVLPLFVRGVDSAKRTLPGLTPLVRAAADGIGILYDKASAQLKNPFWRGFKHDIDTSSKPAIVGLGVAFGNILKGMAGIVDAFLPHMDGVAATMDRITGRFAAFGTRLKGSDDFEHFLAYVKTNGPKVAEFLGNILSAGLDVSQALSPVSIALMGLLNPVLNAIGWLATNAPEVVQVLYSMYLTSKFLAIGVAFLEGPLAIYNTLVALAGVETWTWAAAIEATGIIPLIELIAVAVVALALGIYEAYTRVGWFRKAVDESWSAIKTATLFLWNSAFKPAFDGIMVAIHATGDAAVWLWEHAIGPAFRFIWDAARILAAVILTVLIAPVYLAVTQVFAPVFTWLWKSAIKPSFDAIGSAALWLWTKAIKPSFGAIADAAVWVYQHAIKPSSSGISTAFGDVGVAAHVLWDTAVRPVFGWIADKATWLYDKALEPAFELIKDALASVGLSFESVKDSIDVAWSQIKDIAAKPVKFVVDSVYNHGILPVWNGVAKITGVKTLKEVDTSKWATGGVLPGFTPGRDPHKFYSPTGGRLELSGGESVMRPEWTAAVGAGFVHLMNRIASTQGVAGVRRALTGSYKGGGILGDISDATGSAVSWSLGTAKDLAGYATNPGKVFDSLLSRVTSMVSGLGTTGWDEMLKKFPTTVVKGLREVALSAFTSVLPIGGGGPNYDLKAHSRSAAASQKIALAMLPAFGWGSNQIASLISLWNGESGWRWDALNAASGAYGIPQALPASKMASAGADWRTNPATQIAWGLKYIAGRYGTPANAYGEWLSRSPHWYDDGGYLPPGGTMAMNHTGRPEPVFTAAQWDTLRANVGNRGPSTVNADVRVFVGDREITDIVRTEIDVYDAAVTNELNAGRRL
jgi:hypothetical protein